jgi:hypothetical protein
MVCTQNKRNLESKETSHENAILRYNITSPVNAPVAIYVNIGVV